MTPLQDALKVCFITLGCAKNEVDSMNMSRRTQAAGFSVIDNPEQADAVVVNTCSFIEAATEESLEVIFDMADVKRPDGSGVPLIVAGCMPSRYGEDLESELEEAAAFVPCSKEDDIAEVLAQALGIELADLETRSEEKEATPISAYVKISDGCNRFCSFCTIPYIRGRYQSFTYESIYTDVARLVSGETREIVLIAQDTGRWGDDFDEPSTLARLIEQLAEAFPETWFRVMYIQPEGVSDELLEMLASHDNVCSYLDIPLQHVQTDILCAMNRTGSREEFDELVSRIRTKVPGVTLRTTLIAGFPGETDEDFEALCDFVDETDFDYIGVFAYSREEGTRAASFEDQVDEDLKLERTQIIRDKADAVGTARVADRIGKRMDVLVLGCEEDGQLFGRAQCQAPEVDGVVYVSEGVPGSVITVTIDDTLLYEMDGE
ncbi:MAG: 30S ribosomal protein S12 methylthiotransferase RimO [Raoultibacter sp.]